MTKLLEGRAALITGGGQGVGQGVARAFAAAGAKVCIAQRKVDQGEEEAKYLRDTYGVEAFFIQTDVTKRDQVEAMVKDAHETLGALDILVNNAGASFPRRLENHSDEELRGSFDLNYWAVFWAMKAAFPIMKAQNYGRIVNMGSLNAVNAHMFTMAYNASKEAMRAMTRTAAVEWGPFGITCNIICPAANSPQSDEYFAAGRGVPRQRGRRICQWQYCLRQRRFAGQRSRLATPCGGLERNASAGDQGCDCRRQLAETARPSGRDCRRRGIPRRRRQQLSHRQYRDRHWRRITHLKGSAR
jgi:NAD(P)-dependent dehydrogenase (short-subunit alcohol dehydrogenase family)